MNFIPNGYRSSDPHGINDTVYFIVREDLKDGGKMSKAANNCKQHILQYFPLNIKNKKGLFSKHGRNSKHPKPVTHYVLQAMHCNISLNLSYLGHNSFYSHKLQCSAVTWMEEYPKLPLLVGMNWATY